MFEKVNLELRKGGEIKEATGNNRVRARYLMHISPLNFFSNSSAPQTQL